MANSTFRQRAGNIGSFEFAWLCATVVFIALTAVLVIIYKLEANQGFVWPLTIDGTTYNPKEFGAIQQTARGDQCERLHADSPIMERQNTWSNLAYLYAGLLIIFRCAPFAKAPPRNPRSFTGFMVGCYLSILCVFSGLYHASNTSEWQTRDVAGLDAALVAVIYFAIDTICRKFARTDYDGFKRNYLLPFIPEEISKYIRIAWVIVSPAIIGGFMASKRISVGGIYDSTNSFILFISILISMVFAILVAAHASIELQVQHSNLIDDLRSPGFRLGPPDPSPANPSSFWEHFCAFFVNTRKFLLHNIWGSLLCTLTVAGLSFYFRLSDGQGNVLVWHEATKTCSQTMESNSLCSADGFIQAHAVWHVLSALALLMGYDLFARLCHQPSRVIAKGFADRGS